MAPGFSDEPLASDESDLYRRKKRALTRLDDNDNANGATRAELFAQPVAWDALQASGALGADGAVRQWIVKRLHDLLGGSDDTFVAFVIEQLEKRSAPTAVAAALEPVLDREADSFTEHLWQKLVEEK